MKALQYVEIDLPYCSRTFGVAPCTATGPNKCFNSKATCLDVANYNNDPVTLRFAYDTGYLPSEIDAFPSIRSVEYDPATISLGENLGQRATVTVAFNDHRHSDTGEGFDEYLSSRSYDPFSQGTFWGKFRARHPYLRGRNLRLIQGFLGDDLADMETRHFVIDSFSGPTPQGVFTIVAKDILKLADGDRAVAPALSGGFLTSDITDSATALTLSPAGIGNTDYPSTGYGNIGGNEIVTFERDKYAGNNSNCKLLLHADGADASTTISDSSPSARGNATIVGNAQLDTAQKKFGTASILLDGAGDRIYFADSADWTPAGNFCIDLQVRFNTLAASAAFGLHYSDTNNYYLFYATSAGAVKFDVVSAGANIVAVASAVGAVTTGTWYHLAVERVGNDWTIYKDGAAIATTTDASAIPNFTQNFLIGCDAASGSHIDGWIDEYCFTSGTKFGGAFTAPVTAYQTSSDILAITRAQLNSEAAAHSSGDRVQLCLRYVSEDPADIIADLLETYAAVDPDYIPIATWQTETTAYFNRLFTATIANPTSVNTLISEIVEQAALALWWDDVNQQIGLQVLRGVPTAADRFTQDNVMADSLQIAEQPDKRISRVISYFGQINPLTSLTDTANFRSVAETIDEDAEEDYGSIARKEIFSRWIAAGGRTVAERLNDILLARYRDPPRHFIFSVLRESVDDPILAGGYRMEAWPIQDATGADDNAPFQITRLKPKSDIFEIEGDEVLFETPADDLTSRSIIFDTNIDNVDLKTTHDQLFPVAGSGITVTCYVNAGVVVGSASETIPALDIGSGWHAGVTIVLVNNGRISGAGGDGGYGDGSPGIAGGTGVYARRAITLTNNGEIWGGGGGGGGSFRSFPTRGGGGGGGGGTTPGIAGGGVGTGNPGTDGTSEAGGAGGSAAPSVGGAGGNPGAVGSPGTGGVVDGAGGAAGNAIDGLSYCTITVAGDRRGGEIN